MVDLGKMKSVILGTFQSQEPRTELTLKETAFRSGVVETLAKDCLEELILDGYITKRNTARIRKIDEKKIRVTFYQLDPKDNRPRLPKEYRYERRGENQSKAKEWIVTPHRTADGRPVNLLLEWRHGGPWVYSLLPYSYLTSPPKPFSEMDARKHIAQRIQFLGLFFNDKTGSVSTPLQTDSTHQADPDTLAPPIPSLLGVLGRFVADMSYDKATYRLSPP